VAFEHLATERIEPIDRSRVDQQRRGSGVRHSSQCAPTAPLTLLDATPPAHDGVEQRVHDRHPFPVEGPFETDVGLGTCRRDDGSQPLILHDTEVIHLVDRVRV
jgi:hypothetical protein